MMDKYKGFCLHVYFSTEVLDLIEEFWVSSLINGGVKAEAFGNSKDHFIHHRKLNDQAAFETDN